MNENQYEYLRQVYPEEISLDQFFRICGINKRRALYLLGNHIVPYTDSGRKTWKYRIKLNDVIIYLYKRDIEGDKIPIGVGTSHCKRIPVLFQDRLIEENPSDLREYFEYIFSDCYDTMSLPIVAVTIGFNNTTLRTWISKGYLKALCQDNRYLIPKSYLMDFVITSHYLNSDGKSETFTKIKRGYELWKKAK